ncbi:MAG: pantetheine-phosphate adenylyltransferase [Verrucomicrobiota bacterium]
MQRAVYPGSFDPITNGHLDVIFRATHLFAEVVVAVAPNEQKKPLFDVEERIALVEEATHENERIRVTQFDGLLVDFAMKENSVAVVRGLRAISDFEFEFQMALMNRKLEPSLETVFLTPREEFSYVSSRLIKEVARLGGDISELVPAGVSRALNEKLGESS